MHIAVDARNLLSELSGIARYVLDLSAALADRGHAFTFHLPGRPGSDLVLPDGIELDIAHYPGVAGRLLWSATSLPRRAAGTDPDIFWGPAHRLPPGLPAALPRLVSIHDMVWRRASHTMRFRGLLGERALMAPAMRRADVICAVSEATRADITEFDAAAGARTMVVPPPVNGLAAVAPQAGALRRHGVPGEPYVLFVGTIEPRKNIAGLIGAFAALPAALRNVRRLVICGGHGWRSADPREIAARAGIADRVTVTGHVDDAELAALYAGARCLCLPSFHEGFGLPIVEAQRFGVPVVTSDRSSMPEAAGEGALFADPHDVQAIASALERLLVDDGLHARLSQKALENSASYSPQRSADAMEAALDRAVKTAGARR